MRERLAPEAIEAMEFTTTLRGYDKDEVEAFLREIAEDVRDLQRDAEQKPYLSLGDEIGSLLQHARDSAEKVTADALREAEATVDNARQEAASLLAEARSEAERIDRAAGERAQAVEAEAERAATARLADADASVAQLKEIELTVRARVGEMRAALDVITAQLAALEVSEAAEEFESEPRAERASEAEAGDDESSEGAGDTETIWLEGERHNVP